MRATRAAVRKLAGAMIVAAALLVCVTLPSGASAGVAASLAIDVKAGPSGITSTGFSSNDQLTPIGDHLYFTPYFARYGRELWRTDGRSTSIVRDIDPGPGYGYRSEQKPIEYEGRYYFQANSASTGDELWRLTPDGSDAELAADINPGPQSGYPRGLTVFKGKLYFTAGTPASGQEIFRFDGSTVEQVTDIKPGPADSWPGFGQDTVLDGYIYFLADDGIHGMELWRTDGENTELWLDATPGAEGSYFFSLKVAGERLYFATRTDYGLNTQAWRSDGTTNQPLGRFEIWQTVQVGRRVFFLAGSSLGVIKRPDAEPEFRQLPYSAEVDNLTAIGDSLYFTATDDVHGSEPWRIADGKLELLGSEAHDDQGSIGWYPGQSGPFVEFDGKAFLTMHDSRHGSELWAVRNGKAVLFKDILPGRDSGLPGLFAHFGDEVYFIADDGVHGHELWHLFEDDIVQIAIPPQAPKIRNGHASVKLKCPPSEKAGPCRGSLQLSRGGRPIGKASFRIGAGHAGQPIVKLRRGVGAGPVSLEVVVRDDAGNSKTIKRSLRLVR